MIVEGKDYVTLVTCTPYGVNSHRLLIRGERTKYIEEEIPQQTVVDQIVNANDAGKLLMLGCIVVIILIVLMWRFSRRRNKK